MGVIKNLMVRIGADARAFRSGMKDAANTTASTSQAVSKHAGSMKKKVADCFDSSRMSVKEYTETISRGKESYSVATKNAEKLSDKVQQLRSAYDTVRNATEGLDLSKSLGQQIKDAENNLEDINSKIRKTTEKINALGSAKSASKAARLENLKTELQELMAESDAAAEHLDHLDGIATQVGADNAGYASSAGLQQLESQIVAVENELKTAKIMAAEAKQTVQSMGEGVTAWQLLKEKIKEVNAAAKNIPASISAIRIDPVQSIANAFVMLRNNIKLIPANILGGIVNGINHVANAILSIPEIPGRIWSGIKSIGSAAAQAAVNGVQKLWNGLKNLGGSALRGIASIPGKLLQIGKNASAGCGGLGKMVRSIRNIGIASLGMRVAGGMFGQLQSIISSYLYTNESLNASVTSLKNQMGQALLPAINLVLVAMQNLMPVVTAVSNAINSVFTALFGNAQVTTSAITSTAEAASSAADSLNLYGFDQITKVSETSDGSSGAGASVAQQVGEQSAMVQKLTDWITRLKAAFVAGNWKQLGQIAGDGVNSLFAAIDGGVIGAKIGTFVNNVITTAHSFLSTVDFSGIGNTMGRMLTSAIDQIDWNQAGKTVVKWLLAWPSTLIGIAIGTDWGKVGQAIGDALKGALSAGTQWLQGTDWLQLGKNVADLIAGVDWNGLVSGLFEFLGAALGAGVGLLWGAIGSTVKSIGDYFTEKIEEAGGNVALGLLNGILEGLGNLGKWLTDNVISPFMDGITGLHNSVVAGIEDMINTVISGINTLLRGLNQFLSVGEMVGLNLAIPTIPTIPTVSLPRAARGTIVRGATDLTVGEDGTEAVVPLERHTEWLDVLASKLVTKISGNGGSETPVILQFFLGNRKITEYTIKDINQITREKGACPIIL